MPYIGVTHNADGEVQFENGMFFEIFKELSMLLNFSYYAIEPPDGQHGVLKNDGKWSGMVGLLEDKLVDLGMLNQNILKD